MQFIQEGGYGKVFKVDDCKILKECGLLESNEKYLLGPNIVEACFLNTFKDIPFLSEAISTKCDEKTIKIEQKHKGVNLKEFADKLSYVERIKFLPHLIVQLGRILLWLKRHRLAHMDIKNMNLCIDNQRKITLIDFGFVGMVHNFSPCYNGTPCFADPNYLHQKKKISYDYDTFSCGLVIYSFLNKETIPDFSTLDITTFKKDIELSLGDKKMSTIWESMLNKNCSRRISAEEIYSSVKDLWEVYPLDFETKEEQKIEQVDFNYQIHIREKMVGLLIDWLVDVMIRLKIGELTGQVVKLLYKLLGKIHNIKKNEFQLVGASVLYLISIINVHDYNVSPVVLARFSDGAFSLKDVLITSVWICDKLNWDIYPVGQDAEMMLVYKLEKQQIKDLYLNVLVPTPYCLMSEEEKYGYLKKLGHELVKNADL